MSSTAYFTFATISCYAAFRDNNWINPANEGIFMGVFLSIAFLLSFIGSIPKKMTGISYVTFISAVVLLYVTFIIILEYFTVSSYYTQQYDLEFYAVMINTEILTSYCISFFSVINQFSTIDIISELKDSSKSAINKVIMCSAIFP